MPGKEYDNGSISLYKSLNATFKYDIQTACKKNTQSSYEYGSVKASFIITALQSRPNENAPSSDVITGGAEDVLRKIQCMPAQCTVPVSSNTFTVAGGVAGSVTAVSTSLTRGDKTRYFKCHHKYKLKSGEHGGHAAGLRQHINRLWQVLLWTSLATWLTFGGAQILSGLQLKMEVFADKY